MYKQNVQKALDALRDALISFGANPSRIDLPRPAGVMKVGADDFIVAHGKDAKTAFIALERIPMFIGEGISGEALLQKEIEPIRWIIPGLIPEGLTILAGKPKAGKSWLILSLVVALASGKRALDFYDTEEAEVVYLALEDTERRLQNRLKTFAKEFKKPRNAHFYCMWEPVDRGGLLAIERLLTQHKKCKAIFIDTLAKVRRVPKNKNSYYEDYEAASALKKIADTFSIAVVVVHHVRKEQSNDPFDMVSGTNGLTGSSDTNIVLMRGRNEADGVLHVTGRDVRDQELVLFFNEGIWKVLGDAAPLKLSKAHNEILLTLTEASKPLSLTELAQESGRKVQGFKKTADRMVRDGIIIRNDDLKYEPAPKKKPVKFTKGNDSG